MNHITIYPDQWRSLRDRLRKDNPPSVMLSREKMRRVLGFTPRNHTEWVEDGDFGPVHRNIVCLDFFDEQKRTMFLLKYSDWIRQ